MISLGRTVESISSSHLQLSVLIIVECRLKGGTYTALAAPIYDEYISRAAIRTRTHIASTYRHAIIM